MMGSILKSEGGIQDGYAENARREELLNSLGILAASYDRPMERYRKTLIEGAMRELQACYATIDALDLMNQQLEKEAK